MEYFLWFGRMRLGAVLVLAIASNLFGQTITTFDAPGSTDTEPAAINGRGQITGYYLDANRASHGFLRECSGALTTIDVPGSTNNKATAINARGQITGSSDSHGFLRERDGSFTTFDVPDADEGRLHWQTIETFGTAISPAGEIVGWYRQYGGPYGDRRIQGFLRSSDGTLTTFGFGDFTFMTPTAINPAGQIVGYIYYEMGPTLAFIRDPDGTITEFYDGADMEFRAINPAGQIAGWKTYGSDGGFMREADGTIIMFKVPGSSQTRPNAINPAGQIAGHYYTFDSLTHGFLRARNGSFTSFDVPDSSATQPIAMNPMGQITGYYQDTNGIHGFLRASDRAFSACCCPK